MLDRPLLSSAMVVFLASLAPAQAAPGDRDDFALQALQKMGAYLRTLQQFEVKADTFTDVVSKDGQLVTLSHRTTLDVAFPARMRLEVRGVGVTRTLIYDGKSVTFYRPEQHLYATVDAPATVDELVGTIRTRYGIETPLAHLFNWGLDSGALNAITQATVVGADVIGTQHCTQYALRQPGLDWQIWIRDGAQPLPCQFVLTDTRDNARPRHSARLDWNIAPKFGATTFVFKTPANAKPISIREARAGDTP